MVSRSVARVINESFQIGYRKSLCTLPNELLCQSENTKGIGSEQSDCFSPAPAQRWLAALQGRASKESVALSFSGGSIQRIPRVNLGAVGGFWAGLKRLHGQQRAESLQS